MSHSRLAPSNHLWRYCPGVVNLNLPEKPAGEAATEGTGCHLLLEMALLQGKKPQEFFGQTIGEGHKDKPRGWEVTQNRIDRVDYMFAYLSRHDDKKIEAESKSNPGEKFGRSDWYGTADVTIRAADYLEVADYKNGRTFVQVEDNSQLLAYAYGKWSGESNVRLTIVQPSTTPPIRYVDITGLQLEEKAKELNEAAKLTDNPDAPLISGSWCDKYWCSNRENCPSYNKKVTDMIDDEIVEKFFNDLITNLPQMSESKLAKIRESKKAFEQLFEKLEAEMQLRLESGKKINGWVMQPGRSSREWKDEEELIKFLKSKKVKVADYTETKLKSPAQLEKIVDGLDDFIVKKEGNLKVTQVKKVRF